MSFPNARYHATLANVIESASTVNLSQHPFFDTPVSCTAFERPNPPDDETATAQTIGMMAILAALDSDAPQIVGAMRDATAGCTTDRLKAAAIHRWVKARVRFVNDSSLAGFDKDPDQAEVLVRPVDLLAMPAPAGDCDDFSMLVASMLRAAGIRCAFVTVAADPYSPDYSHVYVQVFTRAGDRIPLDASHGPRFGWEAPATGKRRVWPIDAQSNLHGLGFDWSSFSNVLDTGINDATKILAPRYAVPQLNAGQYIQQGNSVLYQQPAGGSALSLPTSLTGNSDLFLFGGALLLVVLLAGKRS